MTVGLHLTVMCIRQEHWQNSPHRKLHKKLEGKYSLESIDPRESEIRAPPQPLPTRFL